MWRPPAPRRLRRWPDPELQRDARHAGGKIVKTKIQRKIVFSGRAWEASGASSGFPELLGHGIRTKKNGHQRHQLRTRQGQTLTGTPGGGPVCTQRPEKRLQDPGGQAHRPQAAPRAETGARPVCPAGPKAAAGPPARQCSRGCPKSSRGAGGAGPVGSKQVRAPPTAAGSGSAGRDVGPCLGT